MLIMLLSSWISLQGCDQSSINLANETWQQNGEWICIVPDTSTILELVDYINQDCSCTFIPPLMTAVPAGDFIRGCSSVMDFDCNTRESPRAPITMPDYEIGVYEVTFFEYSQFINSGHAQVAGRTLPGGGSYPHNWPVFFVNKFDAMAYCNWLSDKMGFTPVYSYMGDTILPNISPGPDTGGGNTCQNQCLTRFPIDVDWLANGFRLPTEAEWEKAARGEDGRWFPWGDECPWEGGVYRANYLPSSTAFYTPQHCLNMDPDDADGFLEHAPVGSYPDYPSPYGAFDMAGNVAEWVNDYYEDLYYLNSPTVDPKGPTVLSSMNEPGLVRGGACLILARLDLLHTYDRLKEDFPTNRTLNRVGFRIARRP